MKLQRIIRDENFVKHRSTTDTGILARENREITSHEAPLASFEEALAELAPIACNILELGKDYTENLTVRGMSVKYSKHGTRSVQIEVTKILSATDGNHRLKTPFFQIEDCHGDNEQGHMECSKKQAEVIEAFITEAVGYIEGKRQQRLLPLVEAEPAEGEELPGTENV